MRRICRSLFWLSLLAVGCGQPKPEIVPAPTAPAIEKPAENTLTDTKSVATKTETTTTAQSAPATVPTPIVVTATRGTAEATFQQALVAFQEGRLDSVYDMLPKSYQTDVEGLLHEFAEKMDAEIWSKSFSVLTKLSEVMKTKKNMILEIELIKRAPAYDSIKEQWNPITDGVYQFATSQVDNIDYLKRAEVGSLLSSASQLLDGIPLPKFGNVIVKTLKSDDQSATLSYIETKDGEAKDVEFVKIENKWLPKSVASHWRETIRNLKARLQTFPDRVAAVKPRVIQHLDGINGILGKMRNAKTQEELNVALIELTLSIKLASLTAEEAMNNALRNSQTGQALRIEINRELSDDEQTKLKDTLLAHLSDENVEFEMIRTDGKTRCRFTPVPEPDQIADVLKKYFSKASVRHSSEKQTIYVETK